jgi:hypothetical protein
MPLIARFDDVTSRFSEPCFCGLRCISNCCTGNEMAEMALEKAGTLAVAAPEEAASLTR